MASDYSILRSALGFVSGENTDICRLCFATTADHKVDLLDVVIVDKPYYANSLTITEMLETLGVSNEQYLPQHLCGLCATSTINSFLFAKICSSSKQKWSHVLDTIEDCLLQSLPISDNSKTAIFAVLGQNKTVVASRKSFRGNKSAAATQLSKLTAKGIRSDTEHAHCKCFTCGELFNSKNNFNRHMKKQTNIRDGAKITCPQCNRRFTTKLKLQEHDERVHRPKTFLCAKCSRTFGSERMLRRHNALSHETVTCKLCSLQCASRKELRVHLDRHEIHKCAQCEKTFQNKQVYRLHAKLCGNQRDLTCFCDICGKGYVRKNSLRTHLKTGHGFGMTYKCDWCEKKFDASSRLRNHIVKHTRERNFYCEHCGGKFVTQAALTCHIRLHTGERPYPCDLCSERFLSASRRAEHKRRKHFGPHLECNVCHSKFGTKHQLVKHAVRHRNPHSKLYVPSTPSIIIL